MKRRAGPAGSVTPVPPPMSSENLIYRPCVGIMVLNRAGLVWIGRRHDAPGEPEGPGTWWQMPQGGIDGDEDPAKAALRELDEETGIRSVAMLAESPQWYHLRPAGAPPAQGVGRSLPRAEAEVVRSAFPRLRRGGRDHALRAHPGVRRLALGGHRRAAGADRAVQAQRLRAATGRLPPPRTAAGLMTCLPQRHCRRGPRLMQFGVTNCGKSLNNLRLARSKWQIAHPTMAVTELDLPYRPCVGIMLITVAAWSGSGADCRSGRDDSSAYIWQMPQGGIDDGRESPRGGAARARGGDRGHQRRDARPRRRTG